MWVIWNVQDVCFGCNFIKRGRNFLDYTLFLINCQCVCHCLDITLLKVNIITLLMLEAHRTCNGYSNGFQIFIVSFKLFHNSHYCCASQLIIMYSKEYACSIKVHGVEKFAFIQIYCDFLGYQPTFLCRLDWFMRFWSRHDTIHVFFKM
jgi:hypothetical protein